MSDETIFEWDEAKRLANIAKHGIDFRDIAPAFADKNALHMPDLRQDYREFRVLLVAMNSGIILAIVYTARHLRTRIISARIANKKERYLYARQASD